MISKKELSYVNNYARFAPYPGDTYAEKVMEKLETAYERYQRLYQNKAYSLIFSNGEEIEFEIQPKNICHLLGVDAKNIASDPMERTVEEVLGISPQDKKDSLTLLKRIIERKEDVIANDSDPASYKLLNYYKLMIRCIAFSKLSDFSNFSYGCINFDKRAYNEGKEDKFITVKSSKFLFSPSDEAITPYFMMGIAQNPESPIYYPETLLAPENYYDFFRNQTLLLPIQILVNDTAELTKSQATPQEKLALLSLYKSIISSGRTNSSIDIFNDYESVLRERK